MNAVFSGTSGALAVGANTVGATQVVDGSLPQSKLDTPLLIDASVRPMFSAYAGAVTSVTNTGAVVIQFNTEEFDTTNAFDTTTGIFAPMVAGYYQIDATVNFASSAYVVQLYIRKGGSIYKNGMGFATSVLSIGALVYLDGTGAGANGYVTITGYSATTQNTATGAASTYFQAALISRSA